MKSLHKFAERFRPKKEWVNELLWYETEHDNVFIHLADAGDRPLMTSMNLYKDGLAELAERMKSKSELQDKRFLIAASKIAKDHPYILRRLGFTIFDYGDDEQNITAMEETGIMGMKRGITKSDERMSVISRADFVARYAKIRIPASEPGHTNEGTK